MIQSRKTLSSNESCVHHVVVRRPSSSCDFAINCFGNGDADEIEELERLLLPKLLCSMFAITLCTTLASAGPSPTARWSHLVLFDDFKDGRGHD